MAEFSISEFLKEARRRRVFRLAGVYIVGAWITLQAADLGFPAIGVPEYAIRYVWIGVIAGFPFALLFGWRFDLTRGRVVRTTDNVELSLQRADYIILALLSFVAAAIIIGLISEISETQIAELPTGKTRNSDSASIAVLPFANLSGDANYEYFGDGITDELLYRLTTLPELRVSSRTSSFAYKDQEFDIRTIAERLGVKHIVEGSVRRAGDRVRVTAQLIDTESDTRLWSETYDAEVNDIFAIQDMIAVHVVEGLKVTLTPEKKKALESNRSSRFAAYDYYLRGKAFSTLSTREGWDEAREMFSEAIEIDSTYAPAIASLSVYHSYYYRAFERSPEHLAQSDSLSRRAVNLAPSLALAHVARGLSFSIVEKYKEAEAEFSTAIHLNPRWSRGYYEYAGVAIQQGKYDQAVQLLEDALQNDPNSENVLVLLAQVYQRVGRTEDAQRVWRFTAPLLEQILELNPNDTNVMLRLGTANVMLGQSQEVLEITRRILDVSSDDAIVLYNVACLYSLAGEEDKALDTLDMSVSAGFSDAVWAEHDGDFDNIRDHPRFSAQLKRMKASH